MYSAKPLLLDVVTIADEVDSQLKQAMFSFVPPIASRARTVGLAGIGEPGLVALSTSAMSMAPVTDTQPSSCDSP
jgi:hypothetical protein